MTNIDKVIRETIKNEYENITPDVEQLLTSTKQEYDKFPQKGKIKWWKYVAVAAIFAIIVSASQNVTIKAFLMDIYQRFFAQTQQSFENNTKDYIKDLNLEYDFDGEKVIIKQYVVSNTGIDFKIYQDSDSKIKIYGCELKQGNSTSYDEMVVHMKDYYIVSNIIKGNKWTEEKSHTICLLYTKDGEDNIYTAEKNVKLDLSQIYQNKTMEGNPFVINEKKYKVRQILFTTWYMKVDYEVDNENDGEYVPMIRQNDEELVYLTAVQEKSSFSAYYQLPKNNEPIKIALGKIDYNKNRIDEMSKYTELKIENVLKEEK